MVCLGGLGVLLVFFWLFFGLVLSFPWFWYVLVWVFLAGFPCFPDLGVFGGVFFGFGGVVACGLGRGKPRETQGNPKKQGWWFSVFLGFSGFWGVFFGIFDGRFLVLLFFCVFCLLGGLFVVLCFWFGFKFSMVLVDFFFWGGGVPDF